MTSSFNWFLMYSFIAVLYLSTVSTKYPLHQKWSFSYMYFKFIHLWNIIKLLLLFKYPIKLNILKCDVISTSICIWLEQYSASTIFTPLLSQNSLNILTIFLYITYPEYLGINTIYISIWNAINFVYYLLTKLPASIFWLSDQFYYNAEDFLLILKYFYPHSVKLEVFVIPIRHTKSIHRLAGGFSHGGIALCSSRMRERITWSANCAPVTCYP